MRTLADQVAETIALSDRVTRNLRITQTYHRILFAMTPLTGTVDVSWPAYAVWASRSVGHYVRTEEIPSLVRGLIAKAKLAPRVLDSADAEKSEIAALLSLPGTFLHATLEQVTEQIPTHLGEGNRIVFEELGPAYVAFLDTFMDKPEGDPGRLAHFLSWFRPGRPEEGGQSMLMDAFRAYHAAMAERDPKSRAEWMLLANLTTGYHEQIRLQRAIASALELPLAEKAIEHLEGTDQGISAAALRALVRVLPGLLEEVEEAWRAAATELFMALKMPDVTMRLGGDVPPLPDGRAFPIDVTSVENPRLLAILRELDASADSLRGSGARDWSVLSDRMNFIADVFRSRQQHPPLFHPPFTPQQVAEIDLGLLPEGPLY